MDQGSKTEPATPRQRQRARERGQVARSTEIVSALMLFGGLLALFKLDGYTSPRIIEFFQQTAGMADQVEISMSTMPRLIGQYATALLLILTPYLFITSSIALFANLAQVGIVISGKPLNPEFSKLSPIKGFQRIFSIKGIVELVKNLLKLILIGTVAYSVLIRMWPALLTAIAMPPDSAIALALAAGLRIALYCSVLLLILAVLDYVYQKFEFEKSIKMSKQEIRDEYKNQEGDPMIKRRIREMGRRFMMSRMFDQLETADAVITNPTHYAVAISFDLEWPAPKVVAKGVDYLALRLIRYAEENDLPVYEQPDLARALYKVELEEFIPGNLFKAVARVLAHLSKHDAKLKRKLTAVKPSGDQVEARP